MIENPVPITDFLQTAASLHRRLVAAEALGLDSQGLIHPTSDSIETRDLESLIRQFQVFVTKLDSASAALDDGPSLELLIKACRKVSRDIVIRLQKWSEFREETNETEGVRPSRVFTARDVEVLGARLLELRDRWASLRPGDDVLSIAGDFSALKITASSLETEVSDMPRGSEVEKTHEQKSQTQTSVSGLKRPPRPAPAGILQEFILESLSFKSMTDREDEVAEAHQNTFEWILSDHQPTDQLKSAHGNAFTKWLQADDLGSIYWITGKPGSGKSTLMRYISDNQKVCGMLRSWAGDFDLVKAGFYFWTSGSAEQRSQTGLLRSLLHQLLSYDREIISQVFPEIWSTLQKMTSKERVHFSPDWTISELTNGFQRFLDHALPRIKLCLFIDGLDEFDGDHDTIIRFFRDLTGTKYGGRVKMCLSSRPWDVFEKAFQSTVPNMKLQDLTYHDMIKYVGDKLKKDTRMQALLQEAPNDSEAFISQVVHQADGVFLWVRLVVRKLLERFSRNAVDLKSIREHLETLPTDLNSLFDKFIFQMQSSAKLTETSELFQLVRAREIASAFVKDESANSLSIWELAFSTRPQSDDHLALTYPVVEATDQIIIDRCRVAQRDVLVRSAGLLDIFAKRDRQNQNRPPGDDIGALARAFSANRITYLHRTIRDYLLLCPGVWSRLDSCSSRGFDPNLRLLRSYVLRLKTPLEQIEHHRRLDEWYLDIVLALTHARHIQHDPMHLQTQFIDEMDRTLDWLWAKKSSSDHWSLGCFGSYEERKGNKIVIRHPFLALCTKFGLERYVLDTLRDLATDRPGFLPTLYEESEEDSDGDAGANGAEAQPDGTPLLSRALEFLTSRQKTIFPLSSPSFVKSLLCSPHVSHPHLGALIGSTNRPFNSPLTGRKNVTPWVLVLRHLRDAKRRGWITPFDVDEMGTERWTDIVRALIEEGGADKNALVLKDAWDPETSAQALLGAQGALQVGDCWIQNLEKLLD